MLAVSDKLCGSHSNLAREGDKAEHIRVAEHRYELDGCALNSLQLTCKREASRYIEYYRIKLTVTAGVAVGYGQQLLKLIEESLVGLLLDFEVSESKQALSVLRDDDVKRVNERVGVMNIAHVNVGEHYLVVYRERLDGKGHAAVSSAYHACINLRVLAVHRGNDVDVSLLSRYEKYLELALNALHKAELVVVGRRVVVLVFGCENCLIFNLARALRAERKCNRGESRLHARYGVGDLNELVGRAVGPCIQVERYVHIRTRLNEELRLACGTADIGKLYLDCIILVAKQYVADIFATLRRYEYNADLMRLYIVGGGGCLVKHFGQYEESRVTILEDICATAKGYEYLAFASIRRRSKE